MTKVMSEKLQKVLAQRGMASRREIERWIEAGRVTVNGKVAELGLRVKLTDRIEVDGRFIPLQVEEQETRVIVYHKPPDEICTRNDPEGRKTVFQSLPKIRGSKWISIGRLDLTTSGILLFTNNGELANKLMHPAQQIEREYLVRVRGKATPEMIKQLIAGVQLDDGLARFEELVENRSEGINHWYYVVVVEGRNRVVRRLWESQGLLVSRLKRVRFGPIFLESKLKQGQWLELKDKSLQKLLEAAKIQEPLSPITGQSANDKAVKNRERQRPGKNSEHKRPGKNRERKWPGK